MIGRFRVFAALIGAVVATLLLPSAAGAWTDDRDDKPVRTGTEVESLYGPFNVPAASGGSPGQVYNQVSTVTDPCPTSDCRITDIVPDLVKTTSTGTTANMNTGPSGDPDRLMLHHFVLKDPGRADLVCPGGLQGQGGIRFFAAGNERTHMHLPSPYGYAPANVNNWTLISHIYNFKPTPQSVYIKASYRYRPLSQTKQATPIWLDVDGCNDSEYTSPTGYSDTHVVTSGPLTNTEWWTAPFDGSVIATAGHSHDIDVDANPPCITHCHAQGGGIAVSAEVRNGPRSALFGPSSPTNPFPGGGPTRPADLNGTTTGGATLCRSEAKYGTTKGAALGYGGHMDTMSLCGVFGEVPPGAQPEKYPAGGAYPSTGYPIRKGQQVRLHSEYWNNTGAPKNNTMGIMMLWFGDAAYATPQSATPISTSLVPVSRQCGITANPVDGGHSPPLNAGGSCLPPTTTGVAHMGTQGTGQAAVTVVPGNQTTPADEADINFTSTITDVRSTSPTGADYNPNGGNPDLTLAATWRMTDHNNQTPPISPATTTQFDFPVPVDCTTTIGAEGANCSASTSAEALSAGSVVEGKATVISAFRLRVNDSGPDSIRGTSDDRLFAQQGYYVP